jgi:hypothetical protein
VVIRLARYPAGDFGDERNFPRKGHGNFDLQIEGVFNLQCLAVAGGERESSAQ